MSLTRVDVRLKSSVLDNIKQLAITEEKKEAEMIRELIDIGISHKNRENSSNVSQKKLTDFEKIVLKNLSMLVAASDKMMANQYDIKKSPYSSIQELIDSIKESASADFKKLQQNLE